MSKLITAADVADWAARCGSAAKFLPASGRILTPGAVDAARMLGVQILYPGQGARSLLKRLAEEVTGGPVHDEDLRTLEQELFKRMQAEGGD